MNRTNCSTNRAFVYGVLFLFFEGLPIAFVEVRGWTPQMAALSFLSLIVGMLIALALMIWHAVISMKKLMSPQPGKPKVAIVPERHLPAMIVAGIILPPALFWAAWTSNPAVPWPAQLVGYIFVGGALFILFLQGFKYVVETYLPVANSAIAGSTFARSFFGAGFPLFSMAMYHNLGMAWATSLLAFIALALAPMPIILYIYGEKLRAMSKNALSSA